MKAKDWKSLQRHPISAEYRDLSGAAWDRFVAKLKKLGIINGRKITLLDGKILDGWQLQRGCVQLGITPTYQELPDGLDPREFVEVENDERRHETPDEAAERVAARRERVAKSRSEGKSIRAIAASEGVGQTTIVRDIEETNSTVPGGTVEGMDGRKRTATPAKPKPIEEKQVGPAKAATNEKEDQMRLLELRGSELLKTAVAGLNGTTVSLSDAAFILMEPLDRQDELLGLVKSNTYKTLREASLATQTSAPRNDEGSDTRTPKLPVSNKSGTPIFDDRTIHVLLVKLTKAFDDRANALGKCVEHENCINAMDAVVSRWNQWQVKTK